MQGLIHELEVGGLYLLQAKVPSMRLVKVAADGVSEMDKKWVDASAGHVSQDDSLVFSKWQVNTKLFSMGQKRQSAANRHEDLLIRKIRGKEKSELTMTC